MKKMSQSLCLVLLISVSTVLPCVYADEYHWVYAGEVLRRDTNGVEAWLKVTGNTLKDGFLCFYVSVGAVPNFIAFGWKLDNKGYYWYWDGMRNGKYFSGYFKQASVGEIHKVSIKRIDPLQYRLYFDDDLILFAVFDAPLTPELSAFGETLLEWGNTLKGIFLWLSWYDAVYQSWLWLLKDWRDIILLGNNIMEIYEAYYYFLVDNSICFTGGGGAIPKCV